MHQSTLKIPGGKLLRVKIELQQNPESLEQNKAHVITAINLTGDFFLHPEDTLGFVEQALVGLPFPAGADVYASAVQKVLDEKQASFVGVAPGDIAQAILMCKK